MLYIQESTVLTEAQWQKKLGLDEKEFREFIALGCLKTVKRLENGLLMRLEFVGELITQNSYIVSFPKCLEEAEHTLKNVRLIREALKHYCSYMSKTKSILETDVNDLFFNNHVESKEYEVYLSLRDYFEKYGVFKNEKTVLRINHNKQIDWKKTIDKNIVLFDDDSAFYPTPLSKSRVKSKSIVTDIFKSLLSHLAKKYENTTFINEILKECKTELNIVDIFNKAPILCKKIRIASSQTYMSDNVLILKIMSLYIEGKISHTGNNKLQLYGTNSFHIIWEYICSKLYENNYDDLIEHFAQPKWLINQSLYEKGNFIPDALFKRETSLYILDAKYYYPVPEKLCSVSDISKQLIYAQISKNDKVKNIFIFPSNDKHVSMTYLGYVSLYNGSSEMEAFKSQRIYAINLSLILAMQLLINGGGSLQNELVNLIN
ncbi:LlaJI family restriction endonuclease [Vibrio alginolyticus]|uniref:LlaJI family restriction endonuclease n=1 Tax=Vibrio alginolyticus TaxID=663 RepID=UPI00215C3597|nr:LlaJI family restriction endonuclease [Vibrio alginolyticus]MCR9903902.1 LlaJI family restriction endonuclease [Vibrio alginolyticus]HCZ9277020.1 LlaJI family restriction endonuclease [Vibrio alginolyticus]